MKLNSDWFARAKGVLIEVTALVSLGIAALALIVSEIRHLF